MRPSLLSLNRGRNGYIAPATNRSLGRDDSHCGNHCGIHLAGRVHAGPPIHVSLTRLRHQPCSTPCIQSLWRIVPPGSLPMVPGLQMGSRVVRLLMVGCMPPLHGDNVGIVEIVAHTKASIIPSRPYRGRSLDMSQQVSTLKCL